jgi:hypothetical protein
MAYTDIDTPKDFFNTVLYTGNGGTQTITGVGFQPDWTWLKIRSGADNHSLQDSVRGANKHIRTDSTLAETTSGTVHISSWNSDGFALGSTDGQTNGNGSTYASWNWKAGTSVSGNTTGSGSAKAYTGSVSTTAGFSIIRYLGNGTDDHTIPHHLGVAPRSIWTKRLDSASAGDWTVLNMGMSGGASDFIELNSTGAKQTNIGRWRNTAPTSSVFTLASNATLNADDSPYIAYCFADVKGYSKVGGSYIGNGSTDGTFVYLGFKPAWVMGKQTDGAEDWFMFDNKRDAFNLTQKKLRANSNAAENDNSAKGIDLLSNGFKLRTSNGEFNASGGNYIFMAFAEESFVSSTGVPATAR